MVGIVGFLNSVVTNLLTPFLSPAPNTPDPLTPVVWAVLAFVRRNFFNEAPTITYNPTQTGQTVTGTLATDPEGDALTYTVTGATQVNETTWATDTGTFTINTATGDVTGATGAAASNVLTVLTLRAALPEKGCAAGAANVSTVPNVSTSKVSISTAPMEVAVVDASASTDRRHCQRPSRGHRIRLVSRRGRLIGDRCFCVRNDHVGVRRSLGVASAGGAATTISLFGVDSKGVGTSAELICAPPLLLTVTPGATCVVEEVAPAVAENSQHSSPRWALNLKTPASQSPRRSARLRSPQRQSLRTTLPLRPMRRSTCRRWNWTGPRWPHRAR